jgi:hypothetical protein
MKLRKSLVQLALLSVVLLQSGSLVFAEGEGGEATLESYHSVETDWNHVALTVVPMKIDGNYNNANHRKSVLVPSGRHVVGLDISFAVQYGLTYRQYKDTIDFRGTFKSGHHYIATGRQNGGAVEVWVADSETQKLASKVLSIYIGKCTGITIFSCPEPILSIKSSL